MKKLVLSSVAAAFILSGCGGSDTDAGSGAIEKLAYYVDSGVEGVHYDCDNGNTGTTGIDGAFNFGDATECSFSLAGISLRTVKGDQLKEGTKILEDDPKTAQLLQSFDVDGDPDKGGIKIDEAAVKKALEKAGYTQKNIPDENTLKKIVEELKKEKPQVHFVTKEEAIEHLKETKSEIEAEKEIPDSTKAFSIGAVKKMYAKAKIKEIIQDLDSDDEEIEDLLEGDDTQCQKGKLEAKDEKNNGFTLSANNCVFNKWTLNGALHIDESGSATDNEGSYSEQNEYKVSVTSKIDVKNTELGTMIVEKGAVGRMTDSIQGVSSHDEDGNYHHEWSSETTIKGTGTITLNGIKITVAKLLATETEDYQYDETESDNDETTYSSVENTAVEVEDALFTFGDYVFTLDKSKNNKAAVEIRESDSNDEDTVHSSGAIHLKDGAGHSIELSFASEAETVILKVDENGDGTFDNDEILKIDEAFLGF